MNTRRKNKRHKEPKKGLKTKTNDGEAEVFVLPPDLLQKLGIDLGFVGSTLECPTNSTSKTDEIHMNGASVSSNNDNEPEKAPEAIKEKEIQKGTTILETADLMKTSVFLSPTFVTAGSIDPGELEISNIIELKEMKEANHSCEIYIADTVPTEVEEPSSQIVNLSVILNSKDNTTEIRNKQNILHPDSDKDIPNLPDINLISLTNQDNKQMSIDSMTDIPEKCVRARSINDHPDPDEVYLSDCSMNSTSSPTDSTGPVSNDIPKIHSFDLNMPKECHKVKIISEEILSPSKLKTLQNMLPPNRSKLIPVSINCVLETNKFSENDQNDITVNNLKNICLLPRTEYESGVSNEDQNKKIDFVELYDEKGNNISVIQNASNFNIITDVKIEDLSQSTEEALTEKEKKAEVHSPENHTFGDIDLVVTGMDIEENEDILENFVHEISSNDDNILKKIEQSEYCSSVKPNFEPEKPKNLACIQPENTLSRNHNKNNKMDDLSKFVVESNTIESLSKELNQTQNNDKVLQLLEMVTKCNTMQTDLEVMNIEQDEVNINKRLIFETEMINMKTNATESLQNERKENVSETFLTNFNQRGRNYSSDLECFELNLLSFKSNNKKNKDENIICDKKRDSELIDNNNSNSKTEILAKHIENVDNLYLVNESFETRDELVDLHNQTNATICAASDKTTIVDIESEKGGTNTSEYSAKTNEVCDKDNDTNEPNDKVKEIAMYLCQFAKIHSEKVKLRSMKIPEKRSKQNALTSKIFIQGVEKPGGSEKSKEDFRVNKVEKTYIRYDRSHRKPITKPLVVTSAKESRNISIAYYEQENSYHLVKKCTKNPEFCLCGDFGRLAYYNSDFLYEHIHFWEHKVADCDRESVFSIYNDADNVDKSSVNVDTEITDISELPVGQAQSSETLVDSICWHSCKVVHVPKQNDEQVGVIKSDQTETKEVNVLTEIRKANDTIEPMQVCNDDKSSILEADDEVLPKNTLIAVSQETELRDNKLNASNASTSYAAQDEIHGEPLLPVKNIQSCNDTVPPKKQSNKDVVKSLISKLKEKIAKKIKAAKKIDSINNKPDIVDMATNSESSKNDSIHVGKQITTDAISTLSKDQSMTEEATTSEASGIDKNVGNLKNVVEQDVKAKKQQSDLITPDTENIEEKKRGKKRRKLEERKEDKEEPACKKSVMCDVCKKIISEAQWESHISTEHCYIAWRSGSSFNFENLQLLKQLQERVKNNSSLKCTFCSAELKRPKKFITHVQRCFSKLEDSSEPLIEESTAEQTVHDRSQPDDKTGIQTVVNLPDENKSVSSCDAWECGVCKEIIAASDWMEHIKQKHEYLAWRSGDPPLNLDNQDEIRMHLLNIVRAIGELICSKCGLARRYPKTYMQHIQQCTGKDESEDESLNISTIETIDVPRNPNDPVKCAVCSKHMLESEWMQHILGEHNYMAWKEGEQPLNLEDAEAMKTHLYNISKETGGLTCNKCGLTRKYVKVYMHHVISCTGPLDPDGDNDNVAVKAETNYLAIVDTNTVVTCGVCHKEVSSAKWIQHIGMVHNYMAYHEGQSLDLNDQDAVYSYLNEIVRRTGYLVCAKCGILRKFAKAFIQHTNTCDVEMQTTNNDGDDEIQESGGKLVCAVCSEEVEPKKWRQHKMEKHFNVAWTVGSIPVDVRNAAVVDILIKEYAEKYKKMVCKVCNATRVSRVGFYAHVIQCGKTEEEIDTHRTVCGVCNKKYLYVYHNQHMTWHAQQEINSQKKLLKAEQQQQALLVKEEMPVVEDGTPGRRLAAQKAKNVIENLKNDDYTYKCQNCKFGGDSKEEILNHVCKGNQEEESYSDSGESAKVDDYSGEESEDSIEVDSDISNEEQEDGVKKKKKKYPAYIQTKRYPFVPKNLNTFLKKVGAEFRQQHFTYDSLFPNLRLFDCEPVPSDQMSMYLPPLEESCKVKLGNDEWKTYKRFQVEMRNCINAKSFSVPYQSLFTGGYIQCISWSRPGPDQGNSGGNFLAVACHGGSDVTRLLAEETLVQPGLIQLWNFGDFSQQAELVLGVAHEYGAVWAMAWCPSGARDASPQQPAAAHVLRLGLLAVTFSSGYVAVFSIPYPDTLVKREKIIQKLKPVAELRQTMNPERKIYQATSVSWSPQKPYESIVVGYGDGTTAYFDINTESPLLKTVEDGIIILYPYHDERVQSKCVTGLDLYPSVDGVGPAGAACVSSASGVTLMTRPGVRPARQHITSAIGSVQFQPLWPSAALVGDEGNLPSAVNEIEWFGGGRRMGGGCAGAGCQHCGRLVFAALPLLCVRYPHPADNTAKKQIACILETTPLSKKRKKLTNDEFQTKVEPTTYEDAITKYGLALRMDKESLKKAANLPRESYPERFPERFPLGDVTSMAFCPEAAHHKKLAIATHSGMLFVIEV